METVAKLVQKYRLAKICRIGAWIIGILGTFQIIASIYSTWANYHQNMINMGMQQDPVMTAYNQLYTSPLYIFFQFTGPLFSSIALYVFYGIVLYAASVIFTAISTQPATTGATTTSASEPELDGARSAEDDDDIVYTSLKPADLAHDRKQLNHHKRFTV